MKRDLTAEQERRLLNKYLAGDFGPGKFATIQVLLAKGYIVHDAHKNTLGVTAKGKEYCDTHHMEMPL